MTSNTHYSAICLTIISMLAVFSFSVTGCATWAWNNKIAQERETRLEPSERNSGFAHRTFLNNNNIRYYKGFYVGINNVGDDVYYKYIFPHVFQNTNRIYLELLIPVQYYEKDAIVQTTDNANIDGSPAYIKVGNAKYMEDYAINPKFILKEDAGPDVPATFSSDYPLLFVLHMGQIGEKVKMRIGRKLSNAELEKIFVQSQNYDITVVCPDTPPRYGLLSFYSHQITPDVKKDCEIWQWSKIKFSKNVFEPTAHTKIEIKRYVGYIITVPVDIITSPIQLPIWIGYYGFKKGFGQAMNYP